MALASKKNSKFPPASEIDKLFDNALKSELHVLDGKSLHGLFAIPKCVSKAISAETELFTNANTPRAFGRGVME